MNLPTTMQAVVLTGHGDLDKLEIRTDWPVPRPADGEVLIQVRACGLNNTDVNTRTGWYSRPGASVDSSDGDGGDGGGGDADKQDNANWSGAPITFPRIQGADVCGTVVAVGGGVDAGLSGRRVMIDPWLPRRDGPAGPENFGYFGSERDGGFAEYTTIDQRNVHPINCDLDDAEIATFATSYVTAENMLNRAGVGAQDRVLISGASGGVGSALIQLAARRGAQTIAMASVAKHPQMAGLGADALLPRTPDDLKAALREAIGTDTVTVAADVVGGDTCPAMIGVLARNGRYVCSGAIAGAMVTMDLRRLYLRDLTFFGATVASAQTFADLVGHIERGEIAPLLAATYPLKAFHDAQQAFMDKQHVGNIVVVP